LAEGNKTEKATPKKRRDERKKGNVFMSKDAVAVASLLGTFATLWLVTGMFAEETAKFLRLCFDAMGGGEQEVGGLSGELAVQGLVAIGKTVGPVVGVAILCAVAATFAQTRFLVSGESIKPKFNRLSPLQGIKRLFSLKSVIETLKNLIKIVILLTIVYMSIREMFLESSNYLYTDLSAAVAHLVEVAGAMVLRIALAFVAVAALDFFYQWWDYEKNMMMTKQEVKEEYKQMEGDPQVKGKIKEIQRRRAQQRMMQQVPGADVVIRNPTHVAVALRYKPEKDDAPVVVAKGLDELALRIVAVAEENRVAIVENVPLARSLFAGTDLDREIPPEFYGPVAEILVYVLKLDQKEA